MKSEVYSWRISAELKADLEAQARRRKMSVSMLLDDIARQWLRQGRKRLDNDHEEQARLRAAVQKCIGTISGLKPYSADNLRSVVRKNLARKYGSKRSD